MPEMPYASEHHGDAMLVCGGDDFVIADAAARLDDGARAGVDDDVEPVAKREEGVGGDDRIGRGSSPAFCALMAAMRAESTRLICPAPTPTVCHRCRKRWHST